VVEWKVIEGRIWKPLKWKAVVTRGATSKRSMNERVSNKGWRRRRKPALDSSETHSGRTRVEIWRSRERNSKLGSLRMTIWSFSSELWKS
jgi:hypothetical protein